MDDQHGFGPHASQAKMSPVGDFKAIITVKDLIEFSSEWARELFLAFMFHRCHEILY